MKQTVLNLMGAAGAFAPFRIANRNKGLVLTYHRFSSDGSDGSTAARAFSRQLDYMTSRYRIVPLALLVNYISRGERLPAGIASITIDDGYRDAYEIAFPILKHYRVPATLFVVTDFVDQKKWLWTDKLRFLESQASPESLNQAASTCGLKQVLPGSSTAGAAEQINSALKQVSDELKEDLILQIASRLGIVMPDLPPDRYRPMTWAQACEMDAAGVRIESHTATHPILTRVSEKQLHRELVDSRTKLKTFLGGDRELFCYPNGDFDHRTVQAVRDAGYKCAVTVKPGLNGIGSDRFRLRRVHSDNNLARFIQCTSGFDEFKNRFVYALDARQSNYPDDKREYGQYSEQH